MAEMTTQSSSLPGCLLCALAFIVSILGVPTATTNCTSVVGIRADFAENTFLCSDLRGDAVFDWTLIRSDNVTMLGRCQRNTNSCTIHDSPISSSLNLSLKLNSQLVINTKTSGINFTAFFTGSVIQCTSTYQVQNWTTDFVYPGAVESCHVQFRTDTWRVSGKCVVRDLFSAYGCYRCLWIPTVTSPASSSEVQEGQLRVDPGNKSATCELDTDFPSGLGRYNYSVEMTYAAVRIKATFLGTDEIRRPLSTAQLSHTCPVQGVAEGSELTCQCTAAGDIGSPNATTGWGTSGNSSDLMTLRDISRADTGRQFECHLMWNKTSFSSLTFVLSTFCTEEKCGNSQARAEGIGIGFVICLAIVIVAVGTLVLIQWRRGRLALGHRSCLTVDCCREAQGEGQGVQTSGTLHRGTNKKKTEATDFLEANKYENPAYVKTDTKPAEATLKRKDTPADFIADQTKKKTSDANSNSGETEDETYEPIDCRQEPPRTYERLVASMASSDIHSTDATSTTEEPRDDVYENTDEEHEPQQLYGNT